MPISSMIYNFKKLNFCNFPPHFSCLSAPHDVPFQRASYADEFPGKSPNVIKLEIQ